MLLTNAATSKNPAGDIVHKTGHAAAAVCIYRNECHAQFIRDQYTTAEICTEYTNFRSVCK